MLCVLFLSAKACAVPGPWKIWVGQYLGIGILAVAAAVAAWALTPVPVEWVGLLGLVPLALGCYALAKSARSSADIPVTRSLTLPAIITVTVANGGDNISVYTPLFRSMGAFRGGPCRVDFRSNGGGVVRSWLLVDGAPESRRALSSGWTLGHPAGVHRAWGYRNCPLRSHVRVDSGVIEYSARGDVHSVSVVGEIDVGAAQCGDRSPKI